MGFGKDLRRHLGITRPCCCVVAMWKINLECFTLAVQQKDWANGIDVSSLRQAVARLSSFLTSYFLIEDPP